MFKKLALGLLLSIAAMSCFSQVMSYPPTGIPYSNGNGAAVKSGWSTSLSVPTLGTIVPVAYAAPTSTTCGTGPVVTGASSAAFQIVTGTSMGSTCVLVLPAAPLGWTCKASDTTTTTVGLDQTAVTTTGATMTSYVRTSGVAGNMTAADVLVFACTPY